MDTIRYFIALLLVVSLPALFLYWLLISSNFPEIAPDRYPRVLLMDGIYARLRHPRYVQLLIVLVGYALIANYLASYIVVALWLPAIQVIVALEEKELLEHFGERYADYCRRVPRFIPKIRSTAKQDGWTSDPLCAIFILRDTK